MTFQYSTLLLTLSSASLLVACGEQSAIDTIESSEKAALHRTYANETEELARLILPADANASGCSMDGTGLAKAFSQPAAGGSTTVPAPNSLDPKFLPENATDCAFYQWSLEMFGNLTTKTGGGGNRLFNSAYFYNVSPEENGTRTLLPSDGKLMLAARHAKSDDIGRFGEAVEETGQAGSAGVLISQAGSIVYYGIHVNDVYANFLGAYTAAATKPTRFPISATDMAPVCAFSKTKDGVEMLSPNALTLELKTSWVEVSKVARPDNYITMPATLPVFETVTDRTGSDPVYRLTDRTHVAEVALTGMHVVGSVRGHKEMVWATFEHVSNAPDATYYYKSTEMAKGKNIIKHSPMTTGLNWQFANPNLNEANANVQHLTMKADSGASTGSIYPATSTVNPYEKTQVLRENPWGSLKDISGGTPSENQATQTGMVIALNRMVQDMYESAGDVRSNYVMIGSVWTSNGHVPGNLDKLPVTLAGTTTVSNSTMETFTQDSPGSDGPSGCFDCHTYYAPAGDHDISVSHIFDHLNKSKISLKGLGLPPLQVLGPIDQNVCQSGG